MRIGHERATFHSKTWIKKAYHIHANSIELSQEKEWDSYTLGIHLCSLGTQNGRQDGKVESPCTFPIKTSLFTILYYTKHSKYCRSLQLQGATTTNEPPIYIVVKFIRMDEILFKWMKNCWIGWIYLSQFKIHSIWSV